MSQKWKRGLFLLFFVFLVILISSCVNSPQEVAQVFGGGFAPSARRELTETCGQMATRLSTQAGCYNPGNWAEMPSNGGTCIPSLDCECCLLSSPVQEASQPPVTPQPPEEGEALRPTKEVILISRKIAIAITGIGFLLLALGSFFLEREVQKSFFLPLAEVLGAVVYGLILGELWVSQMFLAFGITPTLELGWKVEILLVSALAGLGVFWAVSEQAKSWQNTAGYILLVLSGILVWWSTGIFSYIPVVVSP